MKICTLCEENKNIEEFYLSKGKRISRCKNCRKTLSREYAIENKERIKDYMKKWKSENSDKVKKNIKKYNSSDSSKLSKKKWNVKNKNYYYGYYEKNKEELTIYKKEWYSDNKGYDADDLRRHIESLFTEGMSWDNHGDWHIDHIFPLSKFDEDTDVKIVNSLGNLQPLWAFDNLSKGNKIIEIDE